MDKRVNMTKRKAPSDEDDLAVQLYRKKPLLEVQAEMAAKGVKKTKSQLESIVSRKVKKNIKKSEWAYIAHKLREREAEDKESVVEHNGEKVPSSKIKKQSAAQAFRTTWERFFNYVAPSTPPGIIVRSPTPPSACPSPLAVHYDEDDLEPNIMVSLSDRDERRAPSTHVLPLLEFLAWFDQYACGLTSDQLRRMTPEIRPYVGHVLGAGSPSRTQVQHTSVPPMRSVQQAAVSLHSRSTSHNSSHLTFQDYEKYLPTSVLEKLITSDAGTRSTYDKKSLGVALTRFVGALSNNARDIHRNNYDSGGILDAHELAIIDSGSDVLRCILRQPYYTIASFAEKLFASAVQQENYKLLNIVLESGVDVNTRALRSRHDLPMTALHFAVAHRRENMIEFILAKQSTNQYLDQDNQQDDVDLLKSALVSGDVKFLQALFSNESSRTRFKPLITFETLHLAVCECSLETMNLIVESSPTVLEIARSRPWSLLEAAATRKGTGFFLALVAYGLNVHWYDEDGRGSALAAACSCDNTPLVDWLLSAKVDLEREAWDPYLYNQGKGQLLGMAPLHIAIYHQHENLVRLLLFHGANFDQYCSGYPIQYAALTGHKAILLLLLQSGASVDSRYDGIARPEDQLIASDRTAIHIAFDQGHLDVVTTLQEFGAVLCPMLTLVDYRKLRNEIKQRCLSVGKKDVACSFTPWGKILREHRLEFIQKIIQKGYINKPMTSDDMAIGIFEHGLNAMNGLFPQDSLLSRLWTAISPALLYATVSKANEVHICEAFKAMARRIGLEDTIAEFGPRALVLAVERNEEPVINLLLQSGVSPFEPDPEWNGADPWISRWTMRPIEDGCTTAFNYAVASRRHLSIRIFLEWHRSSSDSEEKKKRESQMSAAYLYTMCVRDNVLWSLFEQEVRKNTNIFQYLDFDDVQKGLSIALRKAIHQGADRGNYDRALWLLEDIQDVNCRYEEHTLLQAAAFENSAVLTIALIQKGAHVNASPDSRRGATALQFAALNGNFEIVQILLEAKADINAAPAFYKGRSAIEGAAEWGRLDMVWFLLEAGANVKGRANGNYRRTISRAWRNGHQTVVRMIQDWKTEEYGADDCNDIHSVLATISNLELDYHIEASESDHSSDEEYSSSEGYSSDKEYTQREEAIRGDEAISDEDGFSVPNERNHMYAEEEVPHQQHILVTGHVLEEGHGFAKELVQYTFDWNYAFSGGEGPASH
ncbi:hypothetical protein NX059_007265 [Plenodomus lindquistii]|nr:hypothetical protein NX059_007265 [Plenodomus lindquistii]